jgi:hypothetical protein
MGMKTIFPVGLISCFLLLLLILFPYTSFGGTVLYVEPLGSCGDNTPCYSTIQEAIDDALSGGTIRIAKGDYYENLTLGLSGNVILEGGWDTLFTTRTVDAGSSTNTAVKGTMTVMGDTNGAVIVDALVLETKTTHFGGSIPDTGQTRCYNNSVEITCPKKGDFYGQDANYTINPPAYTKLDSSGNELDAGATDWVMVRDDITKLIWEVKTDDSGIHDKDNLYAWQDAKDVFIAQLNSDNFGGRANWRVPTIKELSTLVYADAFDRAINVTYFPNTMSSPYYWSSTTHANITDGAWIVGFFHGHVAGGHDKSQNYIVRAVSGAQLSDNLIDNGDGTVTDTTTGLMWQQSETDAIAWEAAIAYCENLELAGYDDWRLPNRNELQSIVDYETYDPAIDTALFPGAMSSGYWSSTTRVYNTAGAWHVGFIAGYVRNGIKLDGYDVRAVRGGQ